MHPETHTFKSILDGSEPFLRDHRVRGEAVLPGVAYLEMARAAAVAADCGEVVGLRNVVWLTPLVVRAEPQEIEVQIARAAGKTTFAVRRSGSGAALLAQGEVVLGAAAAAPRVAVDEIARACAHPWPGDELYAFFARQGLQYGESFRCLEEVRRADDAVVARFRLPAAVAAEAGAFTLHPGVSDGALQATVGLYLRELQAPVGAVQLPFALKELVLYAPTPAVGRVVARWSPGSSAAASVPRLDIDIVDESGALCVAMRELSTRRLAAPAATDLLFATTAWVDAPLPALAASAEARAQLVLADAAAAPAALPPAVETIRLPTVAEIGDAVEPAQLMALAAQSLEHIRALLQRRPRPDVLFVVSGDRFAHASLAGLVKTLRQEHRDVRAKLLFVAAELPAEAWRRIVAAELQGGFDDVEVRYDADGRRQARRVQEIASPAAAASLFRAGAVYWITGGLGGLGRIFARHIAGTPGTTIVVSGRGAADESARAWLEELRRGGAVVEHLPVDVRDRQALARALAGLKARHGRLDGIIHAAGVVRDGYILHNSGAALEEVFAAKALGLVALDEVTRDEPLDFFVAFSSVASVWGNPGQADYAAANALLDRFAAHRNRLVRAGRRQGRTLSIGWPLWRAGGMRVDAATEELTERLYGLVPLDEEAGLDAFARAMATPLDHVVVLSGRADKLRDKLLGAAPAVVRTAAVAAPPAADAAPRLAAEVQRALVQCVSRILKIAEADIDLETELSAYGFDSISLTELSNQLNAELGVELLPTAFFEHPSLGALVRLLVDEHGDALSRRFAVEPSEPVVATPPPSAAPTPPGAPAVMPAPVPAAPPAEGIAVIGMSGRFPHARDLDEFWANLVAGRDCIDVVPADRWDWRAIFGDPHRQPNTTNVKWGGFIDDVAGFDAPFFSISPREAERMDPQHRLLLEHVWAAMEDAGYGARSLAGTRTGVFFAIGPGSHRQPESEPIDGYTAIGAVPSMAPNRVSYILNLRGPSEPVETACSSSLVAVHRAVQAIVGGSCDQAFVGAVNTILSPELHICFGKAGMLSEDGRCKTFSRDANGYVRGEGVGVVLLKPLDRARADGDSIYGVIRGAHVNHGGRATSLTAPNGAAQAELLIEAYRRAGIDPRTVSYIETHGTGTPLGDPVEINALKRAFATLYADRGAAITRAHCGLGSVKTNVGHLEVAAGMAGLFKVLLAMQHGELPPTLHCAEVNPLIELQASPFHLVRERSRWERLIGDDGRDVPRRAGVSGFGFGGANAHVIVEEEPAATPPPAAERTLQLVPLSARDGERLRAYAARLGAWLRRLDDDDDAAAGTAATPAAEALRHELLAAAARLVGIERDAIAADERFDDYGIDLGLLANEIERTLGVGVTARRLSVAGSIDAVVRDLCDSHGVVLAQRLGVAPPPAGAPAPTRLERPAPARLGDIAYTLQVGRDAMESRAAFLVRDRAELAAKLLQLAAGADAVEGVLLGGTRQERDTIKLLSGDDGARAMVAGWIDAGKLAQVAELWVRGFDIDWERLHRGERPRRLHLPTYPFARERDAAATTAPTATPAPMDTTETTVTTAPMDTPETTELLEFEEHWEPAPVAAAAPSSLRVLYVGDDPTFARALEQRLVQAHPGSELLRAGAGPRWRRVDERTYEIAAERYEELCRALAQPRDARPLVIVHGAGHGLQRVRALHGLARAIATTRLETARLVVAGRLADGDLGSCYDAALIGFARSLGAVLPRTAVSAVYGDETGLTAEQLVAELSQTGIVRYQAGERRRLALRPAARAPGDARLRTHGVHLVTGGAGGLGMIVAEHLAVHCRARLALVGRRDKSGAIEARLERLRSLGAEARYFAADVADRAAVRRVVSEVVQSWGPLTGVVHAAGLESKRAIVDKQWPEVADVLRAKVDGTRILDEETADQPLELVSYFSSSSAMLGDGGACDYATGNRFQTAYARHRETLRARGERSGRTVAICWPLWRDGGMGDADSAATAAYLRASGQRLIERDEALAAWTAALAGESPERLVLAGVRQRVEGFLARISAASAAAPTVTSRAAPAPARNVKDELKAQLEAVLKIPAAKLDEGASFADLGCDSIALAELSRLLGERLGYDVPPQLFFNFTTIAKLSAHLAQRSPAPSQPTVQRAAAVATPAPAPAPAPAPTPAAAAIADDEAIAIVGMAVRTAGAADADELWRLVLDGRKQVREVPPARWDWRPLYAGPQQAINRIATNRGAFVDGLEQFDPAFFEIPAREAERMDPRQQLILQEAWHAFEDAGYSAERLRGSACAVFVGVEESLPAAGGDALATSHHSGVLAARISYLFDLKGPNVALNTACSSGLVAVHHACQSLLRGECELALAGGVNLLGSPHTYVALSQGGMLSPDGECYAFDERANGMVPGEAAAVVVLKRLSRALADGDAVRAVIRASGVNYDGRTNGLTAPSGLAQQQLIERVLRSGGVAAADVGLVLAHSIGSPLGDPTEVQALADSFGPEVPRQSCALASIKPVVGHTFAASGVVSLIAMCQALAHRRLPSTQNHRRASRYIDFAATPFTVSAEPRDWVASGRRRRGLVGATGMSGTNAFVVVEEALPANRPAATVGPALILLSAHADAALREQAERLRAYLVAHADVDLLALAYTLHVGRTAMAHRLAFVVASVDELAEQLSAYARGAATGIAAAADATLAALARAFRDGETIDAAALFGDSPPVKLAGLPTYPFVTRSIAQPLEPVVTTPPAGSKAAEYYTFDAQRRSDDYREEYLTFCPFPEEVPGFSMTQVLSAPERHPDEYRLVLDKQREMRRVLFARERFEGVRRVLDIGCGCGSDLIELARRHPHLGGDGFTITRAQAELANRRIHKLGLTERVEVHHADSSRDPFPRSYDLILGFEVTCHIAAKTSLFRNIAASLAPDGSVLLMDFVANLRGGIVDPTIDIAISTREEWVELLVDNRLVFDDAIDVSAEIANYVVDPDVEKNIATFPEAARRSSRNFANMAVSLRQGWISYCLLRLKRADAQRGADELRRHNAERLAQMRPYARALAELAAPAPAPAAMTSQPLPSPVAAPTVEGRRAEVRRRLEAIVGETLQIGAAEVRQARSLAALGITSLVAVRLLEAINVAFGLREPTSIMFQFGDLGALADHLAGKLPAAPPAAAPATPAAPASGVAAAPVPAPRAAAAIAADAAAVAIVGLACRTPGARDRDELWQLIVEGRHHVDRVDERHPDWRDYFSAQGLPSSSFHAGVIEDADCFDSLFFDISPREAIEMDPAQRLLLEEIHAAIEDAGFDPQRLSERRVGTFIGSMGLGTPASTSHLAMLGNDGAILSSRIAYALNLAGPAVTVNTACSSSLVALELACDKLTRGDLDMAIVGGVTIYTHPSSFVMMHNAGMLSPSGRCHTFDERADGIVVADGVGVVVLMPRAKALAEHAHVYATIRAIGSNQDGRTAGITAPSFLAQSRLERRVYDEAGVSPEQLQYVEAHGTGTKLGDPVEIHALEQAFRAATDKRGFCAIGSLKANIGHTTAASGVLGLIKTLLAMEHACIPPTAGFARANPHIDFAASPFYSPTAARPWTANADGTRLAAVSAFGFSGTNAHLVIEAGAAGPRPPEPIGAQVVPLSAKSAEQLVEYARRLLAFAPAAPLRLGDVAWTLQVGRPALSWRVAFVVDSIEELRRRLADYVAGARGSDGCFVGDGATRAEPAPEGASARALAAFWAAGGEVDWTEVHRGNGEPAGARQRVPLPTYPFARVRHARSGAAEPRPAPTRESWLVHKSWTPSPLTVGEAQRAALAQRRFALLATPATATLAEALRAALPASTVLLPSQLAGADARYAGVVDLTGLDAQHSDAEHADWLAWLQQVVEHGAGDAARPLSLLLLTHRLERVGAEPSGLAGARRAGLYRMLQAEYGKLRSRHVDTDLSPGDVAELRSQILAELAGDTRENEVCHRRGVRHRPRLARIEARAVATPASSFPADRVLWITGGTRGLGMLCARHFVERYGARKLVLLGREALPARAQWSACLGAPSTDARLQRKLEDLLYLESRGAEVRVLATPLDDAAALRTELARVRRELGEPFGLVHCAGYTDFAQPAFIRKSRAELQRVLDPKIAAVEVLRDVFRDAPLRLVLLFSSVSAALPRLAVGHADYALANAHLDYVAADGFAPAVERCLSIQWPSWRDTGMGAAGSAAYRESGLLPMSDDEGLALLDRVLDANEGPVVMPLVVDPARVDLDALASHAAAPVAVAVRSAAPAAAAPTDAVTSWLMELVAGELKLSRADLSPDRTFNEYGVDSILLAQMIQKIDRSLPGINLDPTVVLENPSIGQLSRYLTATHAEQLAPLVGASPPVSAAAPSTSAPPPAPSTPVITAPATPPPLVRDKIAIVGAACHFPGSPDLTRFWRNLRAGRDCIGPVPSGRWDVERFCGPPHGDEPRSLSATGGFLDGIELFDPAYFGIAEAVAAGVDPLTRQWLEVSAEALADAGYGKLDLRGQRVGVFCGTRSSNFASKHRRLDEKSVIGVGQNFISAHLSHCYDFSGPNLIVDTACASALTAVHLAVQSLRLGESRLAIAGGVDILLDEGPFLLLSSAKILSPDGRCKTFDESANGIAIGEGCGVVVLQRLDDALRDGNKIYGVIDGSAVNCDGHTMGITTPNPERQQEVIGQAIAAAGIDGRSISYVEAHGTGTLIGDPIELRSLTSVLGKERATRSCGVGSVKSNHGHLLSAAGAAGLIKVLLSLVHRELPPTLHCARPNPRFDFARSPLYPVLQAEAWRGVDGVLRAGVSAFGLGGHNAHLLVSDEGVPDARRATLQPRGTPVVFTRRRYWPGDAPPPRADEERGRRATMKFFSVKSVASEAERT